jgi:glycosyltransferase involved in cell wall biosynthesis
MKINILVDAHVFDDGFQGTTTYIKGLYNALIQNDKFEIFIAAYNIENVKKHFLNERFKFIKLPSKSKLKRLAYDFPTIIKRYKIDYAHFQYITPLIKNCIFINTVHDLLFLEKPEYFPTGYKYVNEIAFRLSAYRSEMVCTVSEYSKVSLLKYFKINEEKIVVTPNSIQLSIPSNSELLKKYDLEKYILYVSRFEPRKNHIMLLKAFVELSLFPEYKLVFIGKRHDLETSLFDQYEHRLNEAVHKSIIYLEDLSAEDLNLFYKNASLFVYPSLAEGFGIPPLEAAVAGCKVLCSNTTAMKDFSFFGDYLFDPTNLVELKSKMLFALSDNSYPYGRITEYIVDKYNWDKIASDFSSEIIKYNSNSLA